MQGGVGYIPINHGQVLVHQSTNGLALVHYGLALKLGDKNMLEAVRYLQLGVDTKAPGTQHVRFYYHLGDAMQRLGTVKKVGGMVGRYACASYTCTESVSAREGNSE